LHPLSGTSFDLTVNLTVPNTLQMGVYMLDWDDGRVTTISNVPGHASEQVSGYQNGKWYLDQVSGDPTHPVTATCNANAGNAVISAIMFDNVQFVPEPSAVLLLGPGAIGLALGRKLSTAVRRRG
jgi:hypothetical protein